jgi:hypothetical protein
MSVEEMKLKINNKIDHFSADQLKVVLEIVEKIDDQKGKEALEIETIFEEAMAKYGNTLKKLAQ